MTNPTPMTREQAWETVQETLLWQFADDHERTDLNPALDALAFLRSEMERLEGERDRALRAEATNAGAAEDAAARARAAEAQLAQAREALTGIAWSKCPGACTCIGNASVALAILAARLEQGDKDA